MGYPQNLLYVTPEILIYLRMARQLSGLLAWLLGPSPTASLCREPRRKILQAAGWLIAQVSPDPKAGTGWHISTALKDPSLAEQKNDNNKCISFQIEQAFNYHLVCLTSVDKVRNSSIEMMSF